MAEPLKEILGFKEHHFKGFKEDHFKGFKEHHFEGLKIDLNAAEISVQDCKHTTNFCE